MSENKVIKGIYKITNTITNKVYIGESKNIYKRLKQHKEDLNNNKHHSYKLQKDWNIYGENSFKFEVIKQLTFESMYDLALVIYEDNYIKKYNSVEDGYNCEYTLKEIFNGNKDICEIYQIANIYNLMQLNNGELPNDIKKFVINNNQYFNYINKTIKGVTKASKLFDSEMHSQCYIFRYIIKDEYKTLKCDYISSVSEDFSKYLINDNCELIDTIADSKICDKLFYKFKVRDYEKHLFNYIMHCNTNRFVNYTII